MAAFGQGRGEQVDGRVCAVELADRQESEDGEGDTFGGGFPRQPDTGSSCRR